MRHCHGCGDLFEEDELLDGLCIDCDGDEFDFDDEEDDDYEWD